MTVEICRFEELDAATAYAVWRLRQDVFVVEQACAYADLDGRDLEPGTRHLVLRAEADNGPGVSAYLRILEDGDDLRIGRVVVAPQWRGHGLADILMVAAVHHAGAREVVLDAQEPLAPWYATYGFETTGPPFLEDGISHVPMRRPISYTEGFVSPAE